MKSKKLGRKLKTTRRKEKKEITNESGLEISIVLSLVFCTSHSFDYIFNARSLSLHCGYPRATRYLVCIAFC